MNKKLRLFRYLFLSLFILADLSALLVSGYFAYWFRFESGLFPEEKEVGLLKADGKGRIEEKDRDKVYFKALFLLIFLWLFLFALFELYEERRTKSKVGEMFNIIRAISLGFLIILAASFFYRGYSFSRLVVAIFFIFNVLFTIAFRLAVHKLEQWVRKKGYDIRYALILGTSKIGRMLEKYATEDAGLGYKILGFIQLDEEEPDCADLKVKGKMKDLPELIQKLGITDLFICLPDLPQSQIMKIVSDCLDLKVRLKIVSNIFEVITRNSLGMEVIEGIPIIELREKNMGVVQKAIKRLIDIVVSLTLLILLIPLWIIIAIAIKLDSSGSVIFKQKRIGYKGKPFYVYKFRTMYKDCPEYEATPNTIIDPRITPVGRILRKTSLDEFPQLINVLKGEMSLVGPRPEMPFWVEKYNDWQKRRMDVLPGLTGMWQVHGRSDIPLQENIEYDLYYVHNQSLLLDFRILLKTILVVIFGKGAY